jgi:hypothetical protein
MDTFVYDVQGASSAKVEVFKNQVIKLQKVLKFNKWATEEPTEAATEEPTEAAAEEVTEEAAEEVTEEE